MVGGIMLIPTRTKLKSIAKDFRNMTSKDAVKRFNELQLEILSIGWGGILQKYHPEVNPNDPQAFTRFQLYKEIFESIRNRVILEEE